MAGCIYCGKTGKKLCDSCAERFKKRNLQFLFPLSNSDVSAISAICKPKPEPKKAVWTASSDTANKNTAAKTYTSVKQPKVTASKPTSGGSVVSPRNNDVQYEGPYRLLKDPIGNYTGKGKYTFTDGEIYKGDFVDGKRTGRGKLEFSNGDIYEGDFVDGKCVGKGKYIWANGNVYEGNYLDNNFNGKGKLIWKNGDIYEGDFV
ncbi:MAG TPA: hypothetical protein DCY15_03700, partial [Ruminococcaceae bacterium]|nr:hypothetical protein [Oscillospiraceae bacterium]